VSIASTITRPSFDHLLRLSDGTGLFEHAAHDEPRREHGYCVDDVARGLVVICREPHPGAELVRVGEVYLDFLVQALTSTGSCHNRRAVDGSWSDDATFEDWWGRAVWSLGVAATRAPTDSMRATALSAFAVAAQGRSIHSRAMAFAALGAGEVLIADPSDVAARSLLRAAVAVVDGGGVDGWPWPEERLRYSNGSVAEAVLLAGMALDETPLVTRGLELLTFLMRTETYHGHLSVTPVAGRGPGDVRPAFDQQPVEVAAIADACARAFESTRDDRWLRGVESAWAWFRGVNDGMTPMVDVITGAGYDGLEPQGRNDNRGAESTIAAISTAQQALRWAGPR
jgi:hypothetical protein